MFQSWHQTRVVGAPLVGALMAGTHKGCPYEFLKVFAKKIRICELAMQRNQSAYEFLRGFSSLRID